MLEKYFYAFSSDYYGKNQAMSYFKVINLIWMRLSEDVNHRKEMKRERGKEKFSEAARHDCIVP